MQAHIPFSHLTWCPPRPTRRGPCNRKKIVWKSLGKVDKPVSTGVPSGAPSSHLCYIHLSSTCPSYWWGLEEVRGRKRGLLLIDLCICKPQTSHSCSPVCLRTWRIQLCAGERPQQGLSGAYTGPDLSPSVEVMLQLQPISKSCQAHVVLRHHSRCLRTWRPSQRVGSDFWEHSPQGFSRQQTPPQFLHNQWQAHFTLNSTLWGCV